jgi:hypothetical protein
MKTSRKIMLGVVAMLGVTAGAGATATYAWFRTTRTSQINLTNASVFGKGSITVTPRYVNGGSTASSMPIDENNNGFKVAGLVTGSGTITDVSGNGIKMYKPNWNPNDAKTVTNPRILSVDDVTLKNYYVCFGIDIYNKGTESYDIYLSTGSLIEGDNQDVPSAVTSSISQSDIDKIKAQNTINDQAARATRIAFYTITTTPKLTSSGSQVLDSSSNVVTEEVNKLTCTWQQDLDSKSTDETHYKYLSQGMTAEQATDLNKTSSSSSASSSSASSSSYSASLAHESDMTYTNFTKGNICLGSLKNAAEFTDKPSTTERYICTVAGHATTKVNCSIWIEGSLAEATEECIWGKIKAKINLIAL